MFSQVFILDWDNKVKFVPIILVAFQHFDEKFVANEGVLYNFFMLAKNFVISWRCVVRYQNKTSLSQDIRMSKKLQWNV